MTDQVHGKLGAIIKPKPVELHWLHDLLVNPLPKAPSALDHTFGRKSWGMLGNDAYGDCTFAGLIHLREVHALITKKAESWPTAAKVVREYLRYTGGQDEGAVEADLLMYWHTKGLFSDKAPAFAPLKVSNQAEVESAVAMFGAVYLGIDVPKPAMSQFDAHQPWDLTGTRADDEIEGGHCTVLAKYNSSGGGQLTWGAVQPYTWRWFKRYTREAWVILSSEFLASSLVNVPLLKADIAKLGGAL